MQINFTTEAEGDLRDIRDYTYAQFGTKQANAYTTFLLDGINSLAQFPKQGRAVESDPRLRRLLLQWPKARNAHIVIYEIDEEQESIEIRAIYGSNQNADEIIKQRKQGDDS